MAVFDGPAQAGTIGVRRGHARPRYDRAIDTERPATDPASSSARTRAAMFLFPRVLQAAGSKDDSLLAWAWGVNGAASVIGSILAAGLVLETGFAALAWVAIGCYAALAIIGEPARAGAPVAATARTTTDTRTPEASSSGI